MLHIGMRQREIEILIVDLSRIRIYLRNPIPKLQHFVFRTNLDLPKKLIRETAENTYVLLYSIHQFDKVDSAHIPANGAVSQQSVIWTPRFWSLVLALVSLATNSRGTLVIW